MKVLIAAGSSGGHIYPAIAAAFKIKELSPGAEIFFLGSKKGLDIKILKNEGYRFDTISADRSIFRDLISVFMILRRFRPDVVVGFGGYVSFPALVLAKTMGVSTFIHEQNLIPGMANKVLSGISDAVGVSFKETKKYFLRKSRIRETGNPVRASLVRLNKNEALRRLDLDEQRFTIFVMGGSQGAHFINDAVIDTLKNMSGAERGYYQFIHLSGAKDFDFVKSSYESLNVKSRVFSFCDSMSGIYSAADLIISRAGASSIAEITFFGLPSILVPYPSAKVHQLENAKFLGDREAAIVVDQRSLSAGYLKQIMVSLLRDRQRLKLMAANAAGLSVPDAANRLAREIIDNAAKG